jgi:hypothetical protein
MSLTTCSDCGKTLSDAAAQCPNCGRPIRAVPVKQTGLAQMTGGELVFLVLIGFAIVCAILWKLFV